MVPGRSTLPQGKTAFSFGLWEISNKSGDMKVYSLTLCLVCLLQQFEVVVLSRLEWDLSAVTGFDYVDHVLERVSWSRNQPLVRRHARTLVDLCYTGTVPTFFTALAYSPLFLVYSLPYTILDFKSTLYLVCPKIFTWTDPRTLILDNKQTKHKPLQAHSRQLPHGQAV